MQLDLAFGVLKPPFGIIAQGVPVIGRYVVFGNHFTTVGNKTYRLDRHPMMSRHPRPVFHCPMCQAPMKILAIGPSVWSSA